MPLPGGAADKIGNRYELKWLVYQFIRLLEGDLNEIEIEPIGTNGERIEFLARFMDGREEGHQVKRQQASKGRWTLADLNRVGVIEGLRIHTLHSQRNFVFVTSEGIKGLQELTERARDADTFEIFKKHFLSKDLSGEFASFVHAINTEPLEAWESLRHTEFRSLDERTLTEMIHSFLGKLVTGSAHTAYSILAAFAQEEVHKKITATEIWKVLTTNDIHPSDLAKDSNLIAKLQEQLENYLSSQAFDIAGCELERLETKEVLDAYRDDGHQSQIVFLTGNAGTGKSVVAAQVARQFETDGWPILAFRMDRLDPTPRVEDIGRQIFNYEKSPVSMLSGIAGGHDCLLLIEQLDAVSTTSGRHPEFFECVAHMVREACIHPNIRVLLVCRSFDLENDQRFRQLRTSIKDRMAHIPVTVFKQEQLDSILLKIGIKSDDLSENQRQLLQLPLHMRLLADVVSDVGQKSFSFETAKDLFDEFWRYSNSTVRMRLSDQNVFALILEVLCEQMNKRVSLSVPAIVVRKWESDVDILVSANLLVRQGGRIAFFHEGFFDYVFARFFIESGESLFDYLLSGNQDLFIRSQVRQILFFLRDQNFKDYLREIDKIIGSLDVRFHIKKVVFSFIGQVSNPTESEWELFNQNLDTEKIGPARAVRSALWPSIEWFKFLFNKGVLQAWMETENESERNFAFNYVRYSAKASPELAALLFKGIAGRDEETDLKLVGEIIFTPDKILHPEMEALFYQIAQNKERDWEFKKKCYELFIDKIAYYDKQAACRALGRFLERLLDISEDENPFIKVSQDWKISDHKISELAEAISVEFVNSVFSPVLSLVELYAVREGNPLYREKIWYSELGRQDHYGVDNLLWNLVQALMNTAKLKPDVYQEAVERLSRSECRWAHMVLLWVLKTDDYKERAANYLITNWGRFGIWYDRFGLWDARTLLHVISSDIPNDILNDIEVLILEHYEKWDSQNYTRSEIKEHARWYRKRRGFGQYILLSAIPEGRLSEVGRKRLEELRRKASAVGWKVVRPISSRGGFTESPLSLDETAKMSDEQWLSAIQRYATDEDGEWLEDRIIGGARELSMVLGKCAEKEPVRFAELMLRFPKNTNRHYYDAIIMGIRKGELPIALLKNVVTKIRQNCGEESARWIVEAIAGHCKMALPDDLLEVVRVFAINALDPQEEMWAKDAGDGKTYHSGDPHSHGINTVRGGAAEAIAKMIVTNQMYWTAFLPTLEQMVMDPSIAVRSCVADACTEGLRYDRYKPVELFLGLCETDDKLLGTRTIERFLNYTCVSEFTDVLPIIERMMQSNETTTREAGSRRACIAGLQVKNGHTLITQAINGDQALRKGAAQVFSANLTLASYRDFCMENLIPLFDDPSEEVRKEAGNWCRQKEIGDRFESILPVAEAYVESQAYLNNPEDFLRTLKEVPVSPPRLLFRAIERFVGGMGEEAGDISSRFAFVGRQASELILRAYRQAEQDIDLRNQCLDAFDQLLAVEAYGVLEALDSIER